MFRPRRLTLLSIAAVLVCAVTAAPAAADGQILRKDSPDWYTQALHAQVLEAGADGVQVSEEWLNTECPGYQQSGVAANGCIVEPYGCTANFIYSDSASYYIGTARHCVDRVGDVVVMQVDTTTLAAVGEVTKHTSGDGDVGNDFALVRLYDDVVQKWGIIPGLLVGGPQGVYDGCDPQPVKHYGHGYGAVMAQGKPQVGYATNWYDDGYGWTGFGIFGDSGSGVVLGDNRGAGNFTHLIVDFGDYPGSNLAGTRLTWILNFAGVSLVNADGSLSHGPTTTSCGGDGGGQAGGGSSGNDGKGSEKGNRGANKDREHPGRGNGKANGRS